MGSFVNNRALGLGGSGVLDSVQVVKGASVQAGVAGFETDEEFEGAGMVGETTEGCGGGAVFASALETAHFGVEELGLKTPDALSGPVGIGDEFDETAFDFGLWFELAGEPREDGLALGFEFAVVEGEFGAETVAEAVAGGVGFALGGDRPSGFGAVGAGSGGATFGCHWRFYYATEVGRGWRVIRVEVLFSLIWKMRFSVTRD
ncbi:MAG TPA: hypothetical protein VK789_33780 [Bryobacteraceae bacterium]|nr:hypothetical protein [Bryobacteraceae bacterium]